MNQKTFSFPQIINRTSKKIDLSDNVQSINECLGILLRTRPGELWGDPDYGCYMIDRVFQYQGIIVDELIKEDILTAVEKYEPRIEMTTNDITLVEQDNLLSIYLRYVIKETGEINEYNMDITPNDNPDKIV